MKEGKISNGATVYDTQIKLNSILLPMGVFQTLCHITEEIFCIYGFTVSGVSFDSLTATSSFDSHHRLKFEL